MQYEHEEEEEQEEEQEPVRSRTCSVCGAVSEHFYLNYGAAACFSCRAFFRRVNTALKEREANGGVGGGRPLICKLGNDCEISVDNRYGLHARI